MSQPVQLILVLGSGLLWLALALALLAAFFILVPVRISGLTSHPHPAGSYEEAMQRIDDLRRQEPPEMLLVCRLQLLAHAQKTRGAIALVHGYTNCPQQFRQLGQRFYELGYNVLIAPLPHHGLKNRMTAEQARLSAEELALYTDEVVDIACGLGEKVDIAGISAGGIVAAYAGQFRAEVETATLLAPAFGYRQLPAWLTGGIVNLLLLLPNYFSWWNKTEKENCGNEHSYPQVSTHALAQTLRFGMAVQAGARRQAPLARRLVVVTNAIDLAVNAPLINAIEAHWRRSKASLTTYEFPAELGLQHDFIEPENLDTPVELVYSRLVELMSG